LNSLTFEVATLADVVGKAARIAPTKAGEAFDKGAGIHLSAVEDQVQIRATDLKIYYLEVVDAVKVEGSPVWRLSSQILNGIMSQLQIGTGKLVTISDTEDNDVSLVAGKTRAMIRKMDAAFFPAWQPFDLNELEMVPDLGARIEQVQWAADKSGEPPLAGIHLTGEEIVATDRFRLCVVPCEAKPIFKPITIPSGIFAPLMPGTMRDVAIGIGESQLYLMPDTQTQIRAAIYAVDYPNLGRAIVRTHPNKIKFKKSDFLRMVKLAMVFGLKDRIPKMKVFIGAGELAVMMSEQDLGHLGDILDLPGQADHDRVTLLFTPKNLQDAVDACPSEEVILHYDVDKPNQQVRIDGGSGYEAWVAPRRSKEE